MDINGKVALVTGASSGIGEAIARKYAASGIRVGLAARRLDRLEALAKEIRTSGGEAVAIDMDVVDKASVVAGVSKLKATFGTIDILVNDAGLMPASDFDSLKTDEWSRMVDVNLKGLLHVTAAVLPVLIEKKSGHIVNLSSIAGRKVVKGLGVYCATKFAVAALSDGMRMELGPKYGIRVTSLQPGAVESELFEHVSDANYRKQMEDLKQQVTFLKAEDIAEMALFAVQAPARVDIAEVFIMPTNQGW
jgi:NADP-dependent 3-hydroxy acid dehydrogenase YdfG